MLNIGVPEEALEIVYMKNSTLINEVTAGTIYQNLAIKHVNIISTYSKLTVVQMGPHDHDASCQIASHIKKCIHTFYGVQEIQGSVNTFNLT